MDWIREYFANSIVRDWISALGLAAGVALLFQLLGALSSSPTARTTAAALGLAVGFAAAFRVALEGLPSLPPLERWQWSLWLTVGSLLLLFVEESKAAAATLRLTLQALLVGALAWLVLAPSSRAREFAEHQFRIAIAGGGVGALLLLVLAEVRSLRVPGWRTLLAATIAAVGVAATLGHSSVRLALVAASLGAALGVNALLAALRHDPTAGKTATTTLAIGLGSLVVFGWSVRYLDGRAALALVAATFTGLLPLPSAKPWTSAALTTLVAGALAGAAYYWTVPPAS